MSFFFHFPFNICVSQFTSHPFIDVTLGSILSQQAWSKVWRLRVRRQTRVFKCSILSRWLMVWCVARQFLQRCGGTTSGFNPNPVSLGKELLPLFFFLPAEYLMYGMPLWRLVMSKWDVPPASDDLAHRMPTQYETDWTDRKKWGSTGL